MQMDCPCIPAVALKTSYLQLRCTCMGVARSVAHASVMASYTADVVAYIFQDDGSALDTICMEGSDYELGLEDVEVVQNLYYHHVAEFDDFEKIEGIYII